MFARVFALQEIARSKLPTNRRLVFSHKSKIARLLRKWKPDNTMQHNMRDVLLNNVRLACLVLSLAATVPFNGCASREHAGTTHTHNTATNTVAPPTPRIATPREAETLRAAEAAPIAPFEGEGWQPVARWEVARGLEGDRVWRARRSGMPIQHDRAQCGRPVHRHLRHEPFPETDYEIALDAMRVGGSDFFCGLTFPVSNSFCSLIVGGWGGSLLGLSSIDGMDASENETTRFMNFDDGKWYRLRIRVTKDRIEGWLDKDKVVDVVTKDRHISTRAGEIEMSVPLGICSWQTTAAIREVRMRKVSEPASRARRQF